MPPTYARRLAALAGFGFFAHAVFGFDVLLGYALWGLPLLLVRRWSIGALFLALFVCASSWSLFVIANATYGIATVGQAAYRSERAETQAANLGFIEMNRRGRTRRTTGPSSWHACDTWRGSMRNPSLFCR